VTTDVRRVVGIASTLIDRDLVEPTVTLHPDGGVVEAPR
jgi:hypothetical protein